MIKKIMFANTVKVTLTLSHVRLPSLEREGIYYHFEQTYDGEVVIFDDDASLQPELLFNSQLRYAPASGLEASHLAESIYSFTCRQKQCPKQVVLKDYNYENPSLDVSAVAEVDSKGRGVQHVYGYYFKTPEEGDRLAHIFAEQLLCEKQIFLGESTVPFITAGYVFQLDSHFRSAYNQGYLITEVRHFANQSACLTPAVLAGLTPDQLDSQQTMVYYNHFTAISAQLQYRPKKRTERPYIAGNLHAKIDAEGEGEYAQIDEHGRYKVRLPFDLNDQNLDGRASCFIRMMQPYAGEHRGMQFPLTKGTEVMLCFTDGHPDRPMIAGAVNNFESPGPVTSANQTESVIQSAAHNKIRIEDKSGSERVMIESPAANSWIRIGAKNDPITLNGESGLTIEQNASWQDPGAIAYNHENHTKIDLSATKIIGPNNESTWDASKVGQWRFIYSHGDDKAIRSLTVISADSANMTDLTPDVDGIRIRTAGNLWLESNARHGDFIKGIPASDSLPRNPASAADAPSQIGDLKDCFNSDFVPTGMLNNKTGASQSSFINDVMANAQVLLSSFDMVINKEANIYEFGNCCNYNLGNSYAEDHANESAQLNHKVKEDLLDSGGPNFLSIQWPTATPQANNQDQSFDGGITINNDLEASDTQLEGAHWQQTSQEDGSASNSGQLWVQKKYGHDYELHVGDAVSVAAGNTLEVSHGGRHIEVVYRSGTEAAIGSIAAWTHSENGVCKEKKWTRSAGTLIFESHSQSTDRVISEDEKSYDRNTGDLYNHKSTKGTGMELNSFEFDYSNVASMEMKFGSSLESNTYAGIQISNSNYLGAKLDVIFEAAGSIELKGSVGPSIEISNGKVDIELRVLNTILNHQ